MPSSFEDLKWIVLIVIWPLGKKIFELVTGRRKRRIDAIDELVIQLEGKAKRIAELLDQMSEQMVVEATLRAEIITLRAEISQLRASLESLE